jgi:integrase
MALYGRDIAPKHARPKETARRLSKILDFFGGKTLADISGDLCRNYATERGHQAAARRELEELRAAINHHRREGLCSAVVEVVLPPEGEGRERWLTRSEAARLIWSAWRYREVQKGQPTGRRSRQHVARFLVTALYTARRKSAILTASLVPADGRAWIDLNRGILYGRQSAKRSKKRQPTIAIPLRLLAHLRRWRRNGQRSVIEFNDKPIGSIDKAYAATVAAAGLDPEVVPHTTRHTGITWLAIEGVDPYEICRYAGITMEMFEEVYAHHHLDFMSGVHRGFNRHRYRHRNAATEREQTSPNVTQIADFSRVVR